MDTGTTTETREALDLTGDLADDSTFDLARDLPPDERRAALAGWLSDANAVPGSPGLRRIAGGTIASVDALLGALRSLDATTADAATAGTPPAPHPAAGSEAEPSAAPTAGWRRAFGRRRLQAGAVRALLRRPRRDDDDDPPPCPAVAGLPVPPAGFGVAV